MMVINLELSREVAQRKGANRKKQACWHNAARNLLEFDDLATGIYVEGFVVCPDGRIVEHGWIELEGAIIDTTPGYYDKPGAEDLSYFPAKRFTRAEALRVVGRTLPTMDIFDEPECMEVLQQAERFFRTEVNKFKVKTVDNPI